MGGAGEPESVDPAAMRARLEWDDVRLLAECEMHLHRTGGPGGQHRNKVASAVRLVHRPTGFTVTATERRSQQENRANALDRLRAAIAVGIRKSPEAQVCWPEGTRPKDGRLIVSARSPAYWLVVALVLDELAAAGGQVRAAAERLGVTGSSLTRWLAEEPRAWQEANRIRAACGLGKLKM